MNEEELLAAHHIGDVLSILQESTHHMYDPDELLTVRLISLIAWSFLICDSEAFS